MIENRSKLLSRLRKRLFSAIPYTVTFAESGTETPLGVIGLEFRRIGVNVKLIAHAENKLGTWAPPSTVRFERVWSDAAGLSVRSAHLGAHFPAFWRFS
jgi:hypothetical protein